jgi:hypothetical protein
MKLGIVILGQSIKKRIAILAMDTTIPQEDISFRL